MAVTLKGQSAIYEGTSADMKPSDADKNAIFQELDTGIDYYYDGTDWNEIPSSGGGGGGTGTDNYNDLNNKPSINGTTLSGNKSLDNLGIQTKLTFDSAPTEDSENPVTSGGVYTALATNIQGIKVNGSTVNPDSNKVVSITVPTSAADVSALPDTTKYAAALSLTINSSTFVMTGQLKDQNGNNLGTAQTIDIPLESVVVGGSYNSQTKKVVLTLQNGNTIEFSVADLVSGLQTELSASNKLNPAYINYDSTHRAVSDTEKSTWNSKQSALTTEQLAAVNSGIDSTKVEQIETNKNNILLIEQMNGAKNCIVLKPITQWNIPSGLTVTQNDEGAYVFNGTISSGYQYIAIGIFYYTSQTYHIHRSSISGGGYIYTNDNTLNSNAGNEYTYSTSGSTKVYLRIGNSLESVTFDNDTLRPMIITDSAYNAGFTDYQPYAMSNVELTAAIQALQAQLANQ